MLALPGSAYLYQGEELGLEQVDVAPEDRQDPAWLRQQDAPGAAGSARRLPGADPLVRRRAAVRLRPGVRPAVDPAAARLGRLTVEAQEEDEGSTLAFYRRALAARRAHALGSGDTVER